MKPLGKGRCASRRTWWTRDRVITALLRFYREHRTMPTASHEWNTLTRGGDRRPWDRPYPSFSTVLNHFPSFRDAWAATKLANDRCEQEWTPVEEWYLREAAGLISRKELARDLHRTPNAVHRRLYDLGLHSYRTHGMSLNAAEMASGISQYWLRRAIKAGQLTVVRGSKCIFVQPENLKRLALMRLIGLMVQQAKCAKATP